MQQIAGSTQQNDKQVEQEGERGEDLGKADWLLGLPKFLK